MTNDSQGSIVDNVPLEIDFVKGDVNGVCCSVTQNGRKITSIMSLTIEVLPERVVAYIRELDRSFPVSRIDGDISSLVIRTIPRKDLGL